VRSSHPSESGPSFVIGFDGDRPVLAVAGEIDISTADEFRLAVDCVIEVHGRIDIDLRQTTFMDSTSLGVLVDAHHRLGQNHEAVVIRDPSPTVTRVLEITGLDRIVDVRVDGSRHSRRFGSRRLSPTATTPRSAESTSPSSAVDH
jgi:anti-sigma B factor antagonist